MHATWSLQIRDLRVREAVLIWDRANDQFRESAGNSSLHLQEIRVAL